MMPVGDSAGSMILHTFEYKAKYLLFLFRHGQAWIKPKLGKSKACCVFAARPNG